MKNDQDYRVITPLRKRISGRFIIIPVIGIICIALLSLASIALTASIIRHDSELRLESTSNILIRSMQHSLNSGALGSNTPAMSRFLDSIDEGVDIRLTLVDSSGVVLYDNRADIRTLDNHLMRPEVASAFRGLPTTVVRYSDSLSYKLMYHATMFSLPSADNPGRTLVLRAALPLVSINEARNRFVGLMIGLTALLAASSIAVSIIQFNQISKPLTQIVEAAGQIEQGDWNVNLYVKEPVEFEIIAAAMKKNDRHPQESD